MDNNSPEKIRKRETYKMFKRFDEKASELAKDENLGITPDMREFCLDLMNYALNSRNSYGYSKIATIAKESLQQYKEDIRNGIV